MPAIVGNVKIINVGPSSIIHFGDSIILSPSSADRNYAGAGSFNNGDFPRIFNAVSSTNTNDSDVVDANANKVGSL